VAGEALALSMDVDMIAFTGSGPVGRKLMEYSARSNLKRVSLELGGKSPQIVFADCPDLDAAASAAAWGVFYNQGEVCTAASRLLVEASIKDAFLEKVIAVAKTMVPGDPLDPETVFGAMVSERQMNTALDYIATADSQGARRVLGGRGCARRAAASMSSRPSSTGVEPDHTLAREEVFGPVLGVQTFTTQDEAIRLANDTVYGLAAGLWTADINRALRGARR
jgi:gamma-glutamyl-gamma-aminobutyraldehyde dehydrogenase